jgi:hypothetical protein
MSHIVLGPQGEPIFCRSAEEVRSLEASAKRKAEPKCPTCGRLIDDEEELAEEEKEQNG